MTKIKLVRIYDQEQPSGYRILVDRIWPRGKSKDDVRLNEWAKEVSPSTELRKWFNHDDNKFMQFKQKYLKELEQNSSVPGFISLVKKQLENQDVLFLYGAKNREHNQAVVLKKFVEAKI